MVWKELPVVELVDAVELPVVPVVELVDAPVPEVGAAEGLLFMYSCALWVYSSA